MKKSRKFRKTRSKIHKRKQQKKRTMKKRKRMNKTKKKGGSSETNSLPPKEFTNFFQNFSRERYKYNNLLTQINPIQQKSLTASMDKQQLNFSQRIDFLERYIVRVNQKQKLQNQKQKLQNQEQKLQNQEQKCKDEGFNNLPDCEKAKELGFSIYAAEYYKFVDGGFNTKQEFDDATQEKNGFKYYTDYKEAKEMNFMKPDVVTEKANITKYIDIKYLNITIPSQGGYDTRQHNILTISRNSPIFRDYVVAKSLGFISSELFYEACIKGFLNENYYKEFKSNERNTRNILQDFDEAQSCGGFTAEHYYDAKNFNFDLTKRYHTFKKMRTEGYLKYKDYETAQSLGFYDEMVKYYDAKKRGFTKELIDFMPDTQITNRYELYKEANKYDQLVQKDGVMSENDYDNLKEGFKSFRTDMTKYPIYSPESYKNTYEKYRTTFGKTQKPKEKKGIKGNEYNKIRNEFKKYQLFTNSLTTSEDYKKYTSLVTRGLFKSYHRRYTGLLNILQMYDYVKTKHFTFQKELKESLKDNIFDYPILLTYDELTKKIKAPVPLQNGQYVQIGLSNDHPKYHGLFSNITGIKHTDTKRVTYTITYDDLNIRNFNKPSSVQSGNLSDICYDKNPVKLTIQIPTSENRIIFEATIVNKDEKSSDNEQPLYTYHFTYLEYNGSFKTATQINDTSYVKVKLQLIGYEINEGSYDFEKPIFKYIDEQ